MTGQRIYTPATLAKRWECSERHVRNLIAKGELGCFRLGGKLVRIKESDVESFECKNGELPDSEASSPSPSTAMVSDIAIRSEPMMRAKLTSLRQQSMQR
ncbi:helix-turn-helix domain-containing protein [Rhizobium sp. CFBP 8762]|nr:helix-turn-helix domain-containing protein [Rhizobium sp. CFBP 8762]